MTVAGAFIIALAPWIAGLFTNEPDVMSYGTSCLRILGIGFPMYAIGMIITQALNGAGDTVTPTIINLICFWMVQIPLAYWLATTLELGPNGVFLAMVISESLLTVLSVIVFRRGGWKHQQA